MKKLLFAILIFVSIAGFSQAPDINHPNSWPTLRGRVRFTDTFHLRDGRAFDYVVQDKFGQKWLDSLPTINATYWNNKLDSVHVSNDSVYDCVAGVCTLRGVISFSGGTPGGSSTQVQFNNAGAFAGTSAATADATHIWIPTLPGSSSSAGSLTLASTTHATKGFIYLGADQVTSYDETNHLVTINRSGNSTNINNGLVLTNTTAATAGTAVQNAPPIELDGAAWGTTAGTSQLVKWRLTPQSTTSSVAGGTFSIMSSLNGAAFTTPFVVDNSGNATFGGNIIAGPTSTFLKGGSNLFKMSLSANATTVYSQSGNPIQFDWVGDNNYALWNENGSLLTDSVATQQTVISGALLELKSSSRGLVLPRWTTTQKNAIVNKPKGMVGYDSTLGAPVWYDGTQWNTVGINIYNSDGALTGNRTLTGGSNNLTFTGLGTLSIVGTATNITSMIANGGNTSNSSSFSWPSNRSSQILGGGLTSDQTVTMPTGVASGSILFVTNDNISTNGFKWLISGTVTDGSGNSMTYFRNSTSYTLQTENGTAWRVIGTSGDVTTVIESAAGTLSLGGNSYYVFNGTTSTWTLPSLAGNQGRVYRLKNAGSGNLTIAVSGSDNIWDTSSVTTLTVTPGQAVVIVGGASFWYKE